MVSQEENLLTLSEAAKLFPRVNGKSIAPGTLRLWHLEGVNNTRLGGTRVGRRFFTTASEIRKFLAAQSGGDSQRIA